MRSVSAVPLEGPSPALRCSAVPAPSQRGLSALAHPTPLLRRENYDPGWPLRVSSGARVPSPTRTIHPVAGKARAAACEHLCHSLLALELIIRKSRPSQGYPNPAVSRRNGWAMPAVAVALGPRMRAVWLLQRKIVAAAEKVYQNGQVLSPFLSSCGPFFL